MWASERKKSAVVHTSAVLLFGSTYLLSAATYLLQGGVLVAGRLRTKMHTTLPPAVFRGTAENHAREGNRPRARHPPARGSTQIYREQRARGQCGDNGSAMTMRHETTQAVMSSKSQIYDDCQEEGRPRRTALLVLMDFCVRLAPAACCQMTSSALPVDTE